MTKKYLTKRQLATRAELKLLRSVARGKKSFARACEDAADFGFNCKNLVQMHTSNPARGITKRMGEITAVTKSDLDYFPIRFKGNITALADFRGQAAVACMHYLVPVYERTSQLVQ